MGVMPAGKSVRLAELLAALSLGSDLGMGLPMEHVLRQCLISMRLASRLGLDGDDRSIAATATHGPSGDDQSFATGPAMRSMLA